MSTIFEFPLIFGCRGVIFDLFTKFCVFSSNKYSLVLLGLSIFLMNLVANESKPFFLTFHRIITVLFRKSDSFIIVPTNKVLEFFDCHVFCSTDNI